MNTLLSLYKINSKSGHEADIKRFVMGDLVDLNLDIREDGFGNVYITKGDANTYPCIVAHLDEVHQAGPRNVFIKDERIVYALDDKYQNTGTGADDKNGVWVVMRLLRTEEKMKAVLFVQEENYIKILKR